MQYDYTWAELADNMLNIPNMKNVLKHQGEFKRFSITMYSDQVPIVGDKVLIEGIVFSCVHHCDVTTAEEREEGLSYSRVYFES